MFTVNIKRQIYSYQVNAESGPPYTNIMISNFDQARLLEPFNNLFLVEECVKTHRTIMGLCKYLTINVRLKRFKATEYENCQGHVTRVSDILPSGARGRAARVTSVTLPIMWD